MTMYYVNSLMKKALLFVPCWTSLAFVQTSIQTINASDAVNASRSEFNTILKSTADAAKSGKDGLSGSGGTVLLGTIQSGRGAVSRTVHDRRLDSVNIADFMTSSEIAAVRAGTSTTDHVAAFTNAFAAAPTVRVPRETYYISNLTIPANSSMIFENAKLVRHSGISIWITAGTSFVSKGSVELDGNKTALKLGGGAIGLLINSTSHILGHVYSHDNGGHGIYVTGRNISIYNARGDSNGINAGPSGTGDGLTVSNGINVLISGGSFTSNSRWGIAVTTSPANVTKSSGVRVTGATADSNTYGGIDMESISYCFVHDVVTSTLVANYSNRCTFDDVTAATIYAFAHDYLTIKNARLKPHGAASNILLVTGKSPGSDNVHIYDTASSYSGNVVEVRASDNLGESRNVYVENSYNGLSAPGTSSLVLKFLGSH